MAIRSDVFQEPRYYEKLGGKLLPMARPNMNHNTVSSRILHFFMQYLENKTCRVFYEPDVFLGDDNVIPDIVVVCNPEIIKHDGIYGAPDIIVEVLSPSTQKRDKGYKKDLYERSGVAEYWIVDTFSKSVDIYTLNEGRYRLASSCAVIPDYQIKKMREDELAEVEYSFKSPTFSDMEIVLEQLFDGINN